MRHVLAVTALAALVAAAPSAPAQKVRSISERDKASGAQAHPQLVEEYGGAYTGPQRALAERIGKRVALQSGLGNSERDFTVTLLNSPVNNAFAIPGGYVYVTRALMALANDEAELASVLGHEVGHVAARHSASRNRTSVFGQIAAAAAGVLTGNNAIGNVVGQGAQLVTLGFSRSQEYQADDLGIRYLASTGYDPFASADMLDALNRQTQLDQSLAGQQGRGTPTWASTHPNGDDRVRRAAQKAGETGVRAGQGARDRDAYLTAINGLLYGDDPAQGIVDGQTFRHPRLKISFTAPQGYRLSNGQSAVTVTGQGGQAEFSGGGPAAADANVREVLGKLGASAGEVRPTTINGMDAAVGQARGNSSQGQVDVTVVAYRAGTGTYHFTLIAPAGSGVGPFAPMVQSFRRLSDAEAAQVRARRIQVVTVGAQDTVASLARRMAFTDRQEERFRVLNGLAEDERLEPGRRVKLVVFG